MSSSSSSPSLDSADQFVTVPIKNRNKDKDAFETRPNSSSKSKSNGKNAATTTATVRETKTKAKEEQQQQPSQPQPPLPKICQQWLFTGTCNKKNSKECEGLQHGLSDIIPVTTHNTKTLLCTGWMRGYCKFGALDDQGWTKCDFAHGINELGRFLGHQSTATTKLTLCTQWLSGHSATRTGSCTRSNCYFAHGLEDLKHPNTLTLNTDSLCLMWFISGRCGATKCKKTPALFTATTTAAVATAAPPVARTTPPTLRHPQSQPQVAEKKVVVVVVEPVVTETPIASAVIPLTPPPESTATTTTTTKSVKFKGEEDKPFISQVVIDVRGGGDDHASKTTITTPPPPSTIPTKDPERVISRPPPTASLFASIPQFAHLHPHPSPHPSAAFTTVFLSSKDQHQHRSFRESLASQAANRGPIPHQHQHQHPPPPNLNTGYENDDNNNYHQPPGVIFHQKQASLNLLNIMMTQMNLATQTDFTQKFYNMCSYVESILQENPEEDLVYSQFEHIIQSLYAMTTLVLIDICHVIHVQCNYQNLSGFIKILEPLVMNHHHHFVGHVLNTLAYQTTRVSLHASLVSRLHDYLYNFHKLFEIVNNIPDYFHILQPLRSNAIIDNKHS